MKRTLNLLVFAALVFSGIAYFGPRPEAQTSATGTYPEDSDSVNGERGTMIMGRRCTTPTSSSTTDGRRVTICVDPNGRTMVAAVLTDVNGTAIPQASGGSGASDANTTRTDEALDSLLNTNVGLIKTYLSPGLGVLIRSDNTNNDDETEIKNSPGTLLAISGRNTHASNNAFLRCANANAAATTPGTTTVIYEMMMPFGGGWVQGPLGPGGRAFATALTCWISTDKAVTGITDALVDDVTVNIDYR